MGREEIMSGWERCVGNQDCVIGMKTFGASAPLKELQKKFGFEPEQVIAAARKLLSQKLKADHGP